jgi:hypothetical protein
MPARGIADSWSLRTDDTWSSSAQTAVTDAWSLRARDPFAYADAPPLPIARAGAAPLRQPGWSILDLDGLGDELVAHAPRWPLRLGALWPMGASSVVIVLRFKERRRNGRGAKSWVEHEWVEVPVDDVLPALRNMRVGKVKMKNKRGNKDHIDGTTRKG